jgi:hypothetical protein
MLRRGIINHCCCCIICGFWVSNWPPTGNFSRLPSKLVVKLSMSVSASKYALFLLLDNDYAISMAASILFN